jgi:multiple sugar transport system permease protein
MDTRIMPRAGSDGRLRKETRRFFTGLAFISPWVVGFLLLMAYPLGASLYYSFTKYSLFGAPVWTGMGNYAAMFSDKFFYLSLSNTLVFALMAIPSSIVLALSLALLLNDKVRGTSVYRTLIFIPSVVPAVTTAVIWFWILSPKWGLLNGALLMLGVEGPPWLSSPAWAKPSLLIMTLWMIGSDMVLYLAGLQDVPVECYEAAEMEGASARQKITRITIPLVSRVVFFHFVNALIWSFQYFSVPYIVSGQSSGAPDPAMSSSLLFYTIYLYQNGFRYLKMGYASAMAWLMFIVVLALTVLVLRSSRSWVYNE